MNVLIFSGGSFSGFPQDFDKSKYNLVIAADSGYLSAAESGILPDIVIGDFDSCPENLVNAKKIIRLNPVKDATDTQEAIDIAHSHGAKKITILGALGGRIDHTLANIHLLKYARLKGISLEIEDPNTYITLAGEDTHIPARDGFCLSLIPLTDCEGVSVSGVYYPLEEAAMPVGIPYGISNEFTENNAHISVKSGDLLVMLCKSI